MIKIRFQFLLDQFFEIRDGLVGSDLDIEGLPIFVTSHIAPEGQGQHDINSQTCVT